MILAFLERQQQARQHRENAQQMAMAQYAASKDIKDAKTKRRLTYADFLPWPTEDTKAKAPARNTLSVLQKLVDAGALPPEAHAAAVARLKQSAK